MVETGAALERAGTTNRFARQVVPGGLAFNRIPHCRKGAPLGWLLTVVLIVLALLIIVFLLSIGSTYLYALYLEASR